MRATQLSANRVVRADQPMASSPFPGLKNQSGVADGPGLDFDQVVHARLANNSSPVSSLRQPLGDQAPANLSQLFRTVYGQPQGF